MNKKNIEVLKLLVIYIIIAPLLYLILLQDWNLNYEGYYIHPISAIILSIIILITIVKLKLNRL